MSVVYSTAAAMSLKLFSGVTSTTLKGLTNGCLMKDLKLHLSEYVFLRPDQRSNELPKSIPRLFTARMPNTRDNIDLH